MHVRDHGSGFDMRYADKLFEPFQRLHGPEQAGGNGLGLAIVRCVAERHGRRAWAQSEPAAGRPFFVELPAVPASAHPPSPRKTSCWSSTTLPTSTSPPSPSPPPPFPT